MLRSRIRYLPAVVLALGLAGAGSSGSPRRPLRSSLTAIPRVIGADSASELQLDATVAGAVGASTYLLRSYGTASRETFSLYVGYYDSQTIGSTIHSPKNCLPSAGWEILEKGSFEIPTQNGGAVVNRLVIGNQGLRAMVYYWYQGRGRIIANEYSVKWSLLRDSRLLGHTEEALVRLVMPLTQRPRWQESPPSDAARADSIARVAGASITGALEQLLPSVSATAAAR